MTLTEFNSKALTTNEDAVAAIKDSTFDELCSYIADGPDSNVMRLLNGLWMSRPAFTKEQMLEAAVRTLFPSKGYMRCAASVTAMKLAKAIGCERELQSIIRERWVSIRERECNEVVLGLSDTKDFAAWMPTLSDLFDLNKDNDIRTELVRAVNNIVRATESPEACNFLSDVLRQMPVKKEAYSNPNSFQFISGLQSTCVPHKL